MTTQPLQDAAERRTQLAADRTVFTAERTYVTWVRTGLAALAVQRLLLWRGDLAPGAPRTAAPEPDTPRIPPARSWS